MSAAMHCQCCKCTAAQEPPRRTLRAWYLDTFADGRNLEGRELRNHLLRTLKELQELDGVPAR